MQKPLESLDDYVVKAAELDPEPPRKAVLRLTGEVEVLKPLARWERPVKLVPFAAEPVPPRLSWFHRSLVVGGGLAAATLVLASAIVIGVSDDPANQESAQIDFVHSEEISAPEAPASGDVLASDIFVGSQPAKQARNLSKQKPRAYRADRRRTFARSRTIARRPVIKPEKEPHQSLVSKFAPTTLVIYIENGLIRSRIEPWVR